MQAELTGGSRVASGLETAVALPANGSSDAKTASKQRDGISFLGWRVLRRHGRACPGHLVPQRCRDHDGRNER
jgi:hypothetical protein